jgi:tRNA-splicing ligase RtcB
MSRTDARKTFTLKDHRAATEGVVCDKDSGVLDETPGAYKNIDAVMEAQSDLVQVEHTLRQIICVKGSE